MGLIQRAYQYIQEYYFLSECSNYNTLEVRKRSRTKQRARAMFKKHNIPHAKGTIFINPLKALFFVKKHGFPVVVKPNFGWYSKGSFFPITSYKELLKVLVKVKAYWPKTVIETYLKGKNYRVLVINGQVAAVALRRPAHVTGDGKSTIGALIDRENQTRKKMKLFPVISPVSKENETKQYLHKQGLTLKTVPRRGEYIELHNKVALSPGGVLEHIPLANVSKKNQQLFKKVLKIFDSKIFGIDVIMEKGVEVDYDKQRCIFLEVNSRPYIKMHNYPRYGKKVDLKPYLQAIE